MSRSTKQEATPVKGGIARAPGLLVQMVKDGQMGRDAPFKNLLMKSTANSHSDQEVTGTLAQETLYVGMDIGKLSHVAGFVSPPCSLVISASSIANSREGFPTLVDRIGSYVPLTQVYVVLEFTGHYHRTLTQYLQDLFFLE